MKATKGALEVQKESVQKSQEAKTETLNFGDPERQTTSTRTSVNHLIMAYSLSARINGADFAEDYAQRSMATMEDVLGTPDLEFGKNSKRVPTWKTIPRRDAFARLAAASSNSGHIVSGWLGSIGGAVGNAIASSISGGYQKGLWKRVRVYVTLEYWKSNAGKEGFHSRAIAPVDDIFVLVGEDVRSILGFKKYAGTLKKLDTRKEKRQAVLEYMDEVSRLITTGEK